MLIFLLSFTRFPVVIVPIVPENYRTECRVIRTLILGNYERDYRDLDLTVNHPATIYLGETYLFRGGPVPNPSKESPASFHEDNWVGIPDQSPEAGNLMAVLVYV